MPTTPPSWRRRSPPASARTTCSARRFPTSSRSSAPPSRCSAAIAQAIRFGNMLFVSGQGPLDPVTKTVVAGDIEVQTRQTLTNLINVLAQAGADFRNVVNMRVILRDTADFPRFNEVFRDMLD